MVQFDHRSAEFADDPAGIFERIRSRCPVAYTEAWGGFWITTRYRDVVAVAEDDQTFASSPGIIIPPVGTPRPIIPLEVDPPMVQKWRRLVNPMLSPGVVERRNDDIRRICRELISAFIERGSCDVIQDYARPLPGILTMQLMGLPDNDWPTFLEWVDTAIHESAHDPDRGIESAMFIYGAIAEALEYRRESGFRGDDVLSVLVDATIDGRPVSDEDIMDYSFTLINGGLDTTTATFGEAFHHLATNERDRALLARDPGRIPDAVEEFLRVATPVQGMARHLTRPAEVGGCPLGAGERVMIFWAAANRDPEEFPAPDEIRIDRSPNRHLTFGIGAHRCLGSHLARAMLRLGLEEFLRVIPEFRIPADGEVVWYPDAGIVRGRRYLPVEFPPGAAADERPGDAAAVTTTSMGG
ncbi:MAG: cytochrome P450 [Actinomycetota bacterium]